MIPVEEAASREEGEALAGHACAEAVLEAAAPERFANLFSAQWRSAEERRCVASYRLFAQQIVAILSALSVVEAAAARDPRIRLRAGRGGAA